MGGELTFGELTLLQVNVLFYSQSTTKYCTCSRFGMVNRRELFQVDELLDWTTGLSFDDYWTCWKTIATSQGSESTIHFSI